jgi:hypothetical protein
MAKQFKGKAKAITIPIKGVENVEEFQAPPKASAKKAQHDERIEKQKAAAVMPSNKAETSSKSVVEVEELVDEEEDDENSSDEEGSQPDEQAMGRLLELLGDVDASELGLDMDDVDDDEDDSEDEEDDEEFSGSEDDDDDDDDDLDEEEDEDDVEVKQKTQLSAKKQEELAKQQQDVSNQHYDVHKCYFTDITSMQSILERILARIKIEASFFETQTLTCPEPLEITDVSDDLSRELQL